MSATSSVRPVPAGTLLRLGRVSNLPTVWTNTLAATALAGGDAFSQRTGLVVVAMSLFYVGGMYLNDAFDREIDRRERPGRPIPSGEIATSTVFGAGFGMLVVGVSIMALLGWKPGLAGAALAGAVLVYDLDHKGNRFSALVMGLCRALVYVGAGLAVSGEVTVPVLLGSVALFAHVVGLTYAAKQESLNRIDRLWPLAVLAVPFFVAVPGLTPGLYVAPVIACLALIVADAVAVDILRRRRPGAVPRAVGLLIAAIALVDGLLVAPVSATVALVCAAGFMATSALQRVVPGT
jgi:hypothetical protein